MIALHARRSAASVAAWRAAPSGAAAGGGADRHRPVPRHRRHDAGAQRSLALADRLVVLNELGAARLAGDAARQGAGGACSPAPRARTLAKTGRHLRALMVGHLRDEKVSADLLRVLHAAGRPRRHPARPCRRGARPGAGRRGRGADRAHARATAGSARLPHDAARRRIQAAHVLVHASRMEGGAHVVIEAVRSGTPVLASRIDGNVGPARRATTTATSRPATRRRWRPCCSAARDDAGYACRPASAVSPRGAAVRTRRAKRVALHALIADLLAAQPTQSETHDERP